jgi:hypothetical protein
MTIRIERVLKNMPRYYPVDEFSKRLLKIINKRADSYSFKTLSKLKNIGFVIKYKDFNV